MLSAGFVDRAGYRASAIAAHVFALAGLAGLAFLPDLTPDPFTGLLISVMIYAVGGGLLEVLISPIVEALPTENKEKSMSMLHSFYCWGHVAVVLLSTLFFLSSDRKLEDPGSSVGGCAGGKSDRVHKSTALSACG